MGHPRPFINLYLVFFKQTIQCLQEIYVKNIYPESGARV